MISRNTYCSRSLRKNGFSWHPTTLGYPLELPKVPCTKKNFNYTLYWVFGEVPLLYGVKKLFLLSSPRGYPRVVGWQEKPFFRRYLAQYVFLDIKIFIQLEKSKKLQLCEDGQKKRCFFSFHNIMLGVISRLTRSD